MLVWMRWRQGSKGWQHRVSVQVWLQSQQWRARGGQALTQKQKKETHKPKCVFERCPDFVGLLLST